MSFRLLCVLGAFVAAIVAFPAAPAGADTGTLSTAAATIEPGGSTTVTAVLTATGPTVLALTIRVTPQGGATGRVSLSNPTTSTNPVKSGWNCGVSLADDQVLDCLWNGPNKAAGDTATVTVTATASSDALGAFPVSTTDDTLQQPVDLGNAALAVAVPATTTSTTTTTAAVTTSTTPASSTTTTTSRVATTAPAASTTAGAPLAISG